ncbi:hypothetical protein CRYPA_288 [Xyrichtys novacula]|uniref:Paired domain-containing protein n=1 Tax=Xyrichtys novacula TaxID=13765 RepID=A0AAV1GBM1_XYRNO|nr:hypothetical protein CRYPA_288 [Xyrichtys novacula]
MRRQLSAAICNRIVGMRQAGAKQNAIATALGITQGAVSKILKRHRQTGVPTPRPRSGRPRKTTVREDRYLHRLSRTGRTKTSTQLRNEWMRFTNTPVTSRLVRYRLLNVGYFARRPVWKPLLQRRHRQARLGWAHDHLNWQDGHWRHVVFSDESRFLLYRHDGRVRVRRQAHESLAEGCVLPRVQAGGGGVTVWGAFHSTAKCDLHVLDGNMNQHRYCRILETKMLPFARQHFGANFVYQDDNAPPHRTQLICDFLDQEDVEHMEWPAMSPDMNPIENLWAEVSRGLNNMNDPPTNVAELTQAVIQCWREIPVETLTNLVTSMPRRVRALYNARGGHTKY